MRTNRYDGGNTMSFYALFIQNETMMPRHRVRTYRTLDGTSHWQGASSCDGALCVSPLFPEGDVGIRQHQVPWLSNVRQGGPLCGDRIAGRVPKGGDNRQSMGPTDERRPWLGSWLNDDLACPCCVLLNLLESGFPLHDRETKKGKKKQKGLIKFYKFDKVSLHWFWSLVVLHRVSRRRQRLSACNFHVKIVGRWHT